MTDPRFVKRKKPNKKKAIMLLLLLVIIATLWLNLDKIMELIFN